MDQELIKRRREAIQQDARCIGCGSTLTSCKANRGKDPTAPPWFGCCARGLSMTPCDHRPDPGALTTLLKEIESGTVRDEAEILLDSLQDRPRIGIRVGPRDGLLDGIYPADYYARGEDDY